VRYIEIAALSEDESYPFVSIEISRSDPERKVEDLIWFGGAAWCSGINERLEMQGA
jgi:hypothetical protein